MKPRGDGATVAPVREPQGVGVVGLGYWGPNLLRVLAERADVEVRWICDVDPDRVRRYARRYPGASRTSQLEDLLGDPQCEAIFLATPVFTHHELALTCLEAGKHTFVEKPLAPSSEQASELILLAAEKDLVLMCGHTFLYSPPVRKVKQLIDSGGLGELYFISSSRVNLGLHQRDVSVVWDLGPHDFSILLYWLGRLPRSVRATGRDSIVRGIADVAFITVEFPDGVIANVELSWLAPSKLRRTVLVGSEKMVVYEDGSPEAVRIFDRGVVYQDPESFGEYHLSYRSGDILSPRLANDEPLSLEIDDFIGSVRTGRFPEQQLSLAEDVVRLTAAADASLAAGGEAVSLEASGALPMGSR